MVCRGLEPQPFSMCVQDCERHIKALTSRTMHSCYGNADDSSEETGPHVGFASFNARRLELDFSGDAVVHVFISAGKGSIWMQLGAASGPSWRAN